MQRIRTMIAASLALTLALPVPAHLLAANAQETSATLANPIDAGPPPAEPGQCYVRMLMPPVYDDQPMTVTHRESYDAIRVTDAAFAPDTISVKVRDESIRYVIRQPRYEVRTEEVLVRPAYERLIVTPAQFETVTETITVGEARQVWKPGHNLAALRQAHGDADAIYCLVVEPARTITVEKQVMTRPEQVRKEMVPAKYETVTREVLTDPGGVDQIIVPAEYRDIPVQRLATPPQQMTERIPAEMQTINNKVLRTPERFEWVPVLCETNTTPFTTSQVQRVLAAQGYYKGRIDGIAGPLTSAAITRFQQAKGLPHKGYLTLETIRRLGLDGTAARE